MNMPTTRKTRLALLSAGLLVLASALTVGDAAAEPATVAADFPANPLQKPGWILERNDEFNGALDPDLWITNYLESRTQEHRSRARYGFRDNALVLRIDDDQPTYYADDPMKVSSIQTGQRTNLHKDNSFDHSIPTVMKYTSQYGYYEIRAKSSVKNVDNVLKDTINQSLKYPAVFYLSLYENAGWSGPLDPNDRRPKEFVVDYFRAYQKAPTTTDPLVSGATYKIKNVATGRYLDSDAGGVVTATAGSGYDDQDWVATKHSSGAWTLKNARTGRHYLDSEVTNNAVVWNMGEVIPDSLWTVESATGGFRLENAHTSRNYLYAASGGAVRWNTGATDSSTVWAFERKG